MPGTCFKPNLPMAFRAFFSFRLWTATAEPAGMVASPSPAASGSESDELDASSAVVFLVGSSSGSSSILGFAMMVEWQCEGHEAKTCANAWVSWCGTRCQNAGSCCRYCASRICDFFVPASCAALGSTAGSLTDIPLVSDVARMDFVCLTCRRCLRCASRQST